MMTLVCKMDKNNGKTENTLYADGEKWFDMSDEDANDMVQKNTVKKFGAVDAKFVDGATGREKYAEWLNEKGVK